jgi:hypothetical protein
MMVLNNKIPSDINQWHVEYDQNGFLKNENWLKESYPTEDILQLSHVYEDGPILDVGFYGGKFKIYVIYDKDWDNPKEFFESSDPEIVTNKVYEFLNKYANG